jgi:hypothetical protein
MTIAISMRVAAGTLLGALFLPASATLADDVKSLDPVLTETRYIFKMQADEFSCWPNVCWYPFRFGHGARVQKVGGIAVGFDYFFESISSGACGCTQIADFAHRGAVYFRTRDLPHSFKSATLVLTPRSVSQAGNNQEQLITGLFETRFDSAPNFGAYSAAPATQGGGVLFDYDTPALYMQYITNRATGPYYDYEAFKDKDTGLPYQNINARADVLTLTQVYDPLEFKVLNAIENVSALDPPQFPANPGPNTFPVQKLDNFHYRIDVTKTVSKWVATFPDQTIVPLRGFVVIGPDESLPDKTTSRLLVEYTAQLQFGIEDPPH